VHVESAFPRVLWWWVKIVACGVICAMEGCVEVGC
jgi:hypothetical protein